LIGLEIEENGVGIAIALENGVVGVEATVAFS
jgi:hypothetical protein